MVMIAVRVGFMSACDCTCAFAQAKEFSERALIGRVTGWNTNKTIENNSTNNLTFAFGL
jgi:hypothetical protein